MKLSTHFMGSLAGAFLFSFAPFPLMADDSVTREASPNKRFEVRESGESKMETSALHERKTGKLLIDFAEVYGLKSKGENTETKWRRDSAAFAFHYAFLRSGSTVVYRLEGDTFQPLKLPKLPPLKGADGKEIAEVDLNIEAHTIYPIRWNKDGTLTLEEFRIYKGGPFETTYRKIVVTVPAKGELSLREVKMIDDSQREEEQSTH